MPRKTKAEINREQLERALRETQQALREEIMLCRAEDMSWDEIAKAANLPTYVIRVIAGEIRKNRMAPEFERSRRRR